MDERDNKTQSNIKKLNTHRIDSVNTTWHIVLFPPVSLFADTIEWRIDPRPFDKLISIECWRNCRNCNFHFDRWTFRWDISQRIPGVFDSRWSALLGRCISLSWRRPGMVCGRPVNYFEKFQCIEMLNDIHSILWLLASFMDMITGLMEGRITAIYLVVDSTFPALRIGWHQ